MASRMNLRGTTQTLFSVGPAAGNVLTFDNSTATGSVTVTVDASNRLVLATPLLNADGSAAAPSYSFTSDPGNGVYLSGTDTVSVSTNGTLRHSISTSAVTNTLPTLSPDGSASAPSFSFSSDSGNGLYLSGTDTVSLTTNGTLRLSVSTAAVTSTLPVYHPDGTQAAPGITFASDTDTGFFLAGSNAMAWVANNTLRLTVSSTGVVSTNGGDLQTGNGNFNSGSGTIRAGNGSGATPGFSFAGSSDIGLFRPSTTALAFSVAGAEAVRFSSNTSLVETDYAIQVGDGSASIAGYGFNSDPNTGLYVSTVDQLQITAGGVEMARFTENGAGATITTLFGTGETLARFIDDAEVELYFDNANVFETLGAASGGAQANNTLTGSGFERVMTTSDNQSLTVVAASNGGTTTITTQRTTAFQVAGGSILTYTVNLPSAGINGRKYTITFDGIIVTLTMDAGAGNTFAAAAPTAITGGAHYAWVFDDANNIWWPV